MLHLCWIVPLLALAGLMVLFWFIGRGRSNPVSADHARQLFQQQRSSLQSLFFKTAASSGKPRGLRWKECQWNDLIAWVREKKTGQLLALAGVTISFEAIEGGDMEDVEAVGNLRNASAVFFFQDWQWQTAGRVIFNLNPDEAVEHFKSEYECLSK